MPKSLVPTRLALHRLAAYVIAPARYRSTERFGLRAAPDGFATPPFDGGRIRVEGAEMVDERGDGDRRAPITSLRAAADFLDAPIDPDTAAEHDTPAVGDVDADLGIDPDASQWLGRWFNAAFAALESVRADAASVDASEPQLWPGHFDPAIEVGDEDHRASYGASPGDDGSAEPYLYVSVWWPDRLRLDRSDAFWNGSPFVGTMLPVSEFPEGQDPVEVMRSFWLTGRNRLAEV